MQTKIHLNKFAKNLNTFWVLLFHTHWNLFMIFWFYQSFYLSYKIEYTHSHWLKRVLLFQVNYRWFPFFGVSSRNFRHYFVGKLFKSYTVYRCIWIMVNDEYELWYLTNNEVTHTQCHSWNMTNYKIRQGNFDINKTRK